MNQRVYLAGKIAKGDWRHALVPRLRSQLVDLEPYGDWPVLPGAIRGTFDYVGPFFVACDHGCWHGPQSHGMGAEGDAEGMGSGSVFERRRFVAKRCLEAIGRADIVFGWLDTLDAYGTLVEIGFALALKKTVLLGFATEEWDRMVKRADFILGQWPHDEEQTEGHLRPPGLLDELWFPLFADGVRLVPAKDALEAFERAVINLPVAFDSPLEKSFWHAWDHSSVPLAYQHPVLNGRYRLDFAHLESQTAIELDGVTYHGSDDSFAKDRRRDRELSELGWVTVRFTGTEIRADVARCVRSALDIIRTRGRRG